ncbi:hypothetical protein GIV81_20680, partial [Pseudomonas syringae]|nr:hypothetical protein [Pseudomonas syringae]
GLLSRLLVPLCAARQFVRRQLPFAEDLQRARHRTARCPARQRLQDGPRCA